MMKAFLVALTFVSCAAFADAKPTLGYCFKDIYCRGDVVSDKLVSMFECAQDLGKMNANYGSWELAQLRECTGILPDRSSRASAR